MVSTRVLNPNAISIGSAVLQGLRLWQTDWQTNRLTVGRVYICSMACGLKCVTWCWQCPFWGNLSCLDCHLPGRIPFSNFKCMASPVWKIWWGTKIFKKVTSRWQRLFHGQFVIGMITNSILCPLSTRRRAVGGTQRTTVRIIEQWMADSRLCLNMDMV